MDENLCATQATELSLLKSIKQVCEKHDIRFTLFYGTLLGAVRHQGFIPWDDDADVELLRADYDRLLTVLRTEASDAYMVSSQEDGEDFYGGYAKVCSKASPDIWIDILPLDCVSTKEDEFSEQIQCINEIQELLFVKTYREEGIKRIRKGAVNESGVTFEAYLQPIEELKSRLHNEMIRYSGSDSGSVAVLGRYLTPDKQVIFDKADFENPVYIQFEDGLMPVPKSYDDVLKQIYGEHYMALAKKSQRKPKHSAKSS